MCNFKQQMESYWHNLTDADADRLIEAIDQADEYLQKMIVFRTGLIPKHLRWLQTSAHEFYDLLSPRELQVFQLRIRKHTFPEIAQVVGVTESSCKVYWRRTLNKIKNVIGTPNNDG
jgi:DNA-binding NarL/FixJ family response regulator